MSSVGVLVDTSVFIPFLRGQSDELLEALVISDQVILCPVVRLELLVGVRRSEAPLLEDLLSGFTLVENFPKQKSAKRILTQAKSSGLVGGFADLLILAHAFELKIPLYTHDKKLKRLAKKCRLGVVKAGNAN